MNVNTIRKIISKLFGAKHEPGLLVWTDRDAAIRYLNATIEANQGN